MDKLYRYAPPAPTDPSSNDDKLEATNFENSALFLVSCFQYILVAAVFSIGPPFRKQMWTNGMMGFGADVCYAVLIRRLSGWFMVSMVVLGIFNLLVLLDPPRPLMKLLELMYLPLAARSTLLLAVAVNVVTSMAFESYGTQAVSRLFGFVFDLRRRHRVREGKIYKAVEGGMR